MKLRLITNIEMFHSEALKVLNINTTAFWCVTPYKLVHSYQSYRGHCSVHLESKIEGVSFLRNVRTIFNNTECPKPADLAQSTKIFVQ